MAKLLFITANVKKVEDSYSLSAGKAFLDAYKEFNPKDEIVIVDLFEKDIPSLNRELIGCMFGQMQEQDLNDMDKKRYHSFTNNLEEFMSADKYVFVTPLWNLGTPDIVKTYFDNVAVAGKTFKYTENGPVGLLEGKQAVCIQASGGVYSKPPASEMEHGISYIKSMLTFFGIEIKHTLCIEGVNIQENDVKAIKDAALEKAVQMGKDF